MKVRRRNGTEEDFKPEKIVNAIMKAGGTPELATSIARDIASMLPNSPSITTLQIRTWVLSKLRSMDLGTYNRWMEYDKENKKV